MATEEPWVGIATVAAHLGVGKDTIYRWIDTQGLPAHRVVGLFRFRLSQVDEWVQSGGSNTPVSRTSSRPDGGGRDEPRNG